MQEILNNLRRKTNNHRFAWQMSAVNEPFKLVKPPLPAVDNEEVLIEVAGCGVCHTDIGFWREGIKTRKPPPIVLGHEISGIVVDGEANWVGKKVVIPAVLPCGECHLCRRGRGNICRKQKMPGNDFDGGFASHVKIPSRYICEVSEEVLSKCSLVDVAVIADAVSTPYQAVKKSGLEEGDFTVVIGVGGIGIYGVQTAKVLGAKVLAIDIDSDRIEMAKIAGADVTLNVQDQQLKESKKKVKEICQNLEAPVECWKIFEMSGTKGGQELAYSLLGFGSTLSVVGFTMAKLELRLSNLMAYDAAAIGTWGCKPELYHEILELVAEGKVQLKPFVQTFPMSQINKVFRDIVEHRLKKRPVLIPDF